MHPHLLERQTKKSGMNHEGSGYNIKTLETFFMISVELDVERETNDPIQIRITTLWPGFPKRKYAFVNTPNNKTCATLTFRMCEYACSLLSTHTYMYAD